MNNADFIRGMDDYELEQFLYDRIGSCCSDCPCFDSEICDGDEYCHDKISEWLQREAEQND